MQYCDSANWIAMSRVYSNLNALTDPCANSPAPGQMCEDGTVYAGLSIDGGVAMFTTPCDQGQTWNGSSCTGSVTNIRWNQASSHTNYTTTGATSGSDGRENTDLIITIDADSGVPGVQTHNAAQTCADLVFGGYTDWYLPAENEIRNVIYPNRIAIGNFGTGTYWSSREGTASAARDVNFTTGSGSFATKNGGKRVRCTRKGYILPTVTSGLIGYWNMDETTGTVFHDSSGNNDATVNNMTGDIAANTASGIFGEAITIDGIDDFINVGSDTSIDNIFVGGGTISAWIYKTGDAGRIVDKSTNTFADGGYYFATSQGLIRFKHGTATSDGQWATPSVILNNAWQHVAVTFNKDNILNDPIIYINGISVPVTEEITPPDTFDNDDTAPLYIGNRSVDEANAFPGIIDEVRLYNRILSANEIANLYNTADIQVNSDSAVISHWRLDETAGTTIEDSVGSNDGTLSNAGGGGAANITVSGQISTALDFDGVDDLINAGSDGSLDDIFASGGTISAWIYPESYGENDFGRIVHKGGAPLGGSANPGYAFFVNGFGSQNTLRFIQSFSSAFSSWNTPNNSIPLNTWSHVAISYQASDENRDPAMFINGVAQEITQDNTAGSSTVTSDATDDFIIGNRSDLTRTFDGRLDEVKVFNRLLSEVEIQEVMAGCSNPSAPEGEMTYNYSHHVMKYCDGNQWVPLGPVPGMGPDGTNGTTVGLVHHWRLDETTGTAADSAGSNTGTLGSGATWVPSGGRFGGAVQVDGTLNGIVTLGDSTIGSDVGSVSAWIRTSASYPDSGMIFKAGDISGGFGSQDELHMHVDFSNREGFFIEGGASGDVVIRDNGPLLNDNVWHHLVATWDNTDQAKIYVDGKLTDFAPHNANSFLLTNMRIGSAASGIRHFNGLIDEVRVYNRALTALEVKELFLGVCTSPNGVGGELVYNTTFDVMQYCDGQNWIGIGK